MSLASLPRKRVVVLPDVYTDAICPLPAWPEAQARLAAVAARGGGNIPVGPIQLKVGGNAANLALALARLGAQVDLVADTDMLGLQLLQRAAAGTRLSLGRVRLTPTGSMTVALEMAGANVMLSHAGPLAAFGPERLEAEDWALINEADAVAVVNWAQNPRGTDLLAAVARRTSPGTFLFFDSGDPRHRTDAADLVRPAPWWSRVGAFGMNQNELGAFTGRTLAEEDLVPVAQEMAGRLGTRIDFHCRGWAASVTADTVVKAKASAARGRRATGAGDAWNAGDLAGELLGWDAKERLRLAHRVATLYVTGADGLPPDAAAVARPARSNPKTPLLVHP